MKLTLIDIDGNELHENDWVRMFHTWNGVEGICFYVQIKILEDGRLQPFDNFCFDTIRKVDSVPENATDEQGYYVARETLNNTTKEERNAYMFNRLAFESNNKFYKVTP